MSIHLFLRHFELNLIKFWTNIEQIFLIPRCAKPPSISSSRKQWSSHSMDPDWARRSAMGSAYLNWRPDWYDLSLSRLPWSVTSQIPTRSWTKSGTELCQWRESGHVRLVIQTRLLLLGRLLQKHDLSELELGSASVRRPRDGRAILHSGAILLQDGLILEIKNGSTMCNWQKKGKKIRKS